MDFVTLLPEDVPGAMLKENFLIEDHSVFELKRWLECRSLKKTGTKAELINRINNCIANGGINKIFLGIDQGKWYDVKRTTLQEQCSSSSKSDMNVLDAVVKWSRFPSRCLPQFFNKGHIYTYIVDANVENEDPDVTDHGTTTVKPFRRGNQFVDSDYLSQVYDAKQNTMYMCKCECQASFDKKIKYIVTVALNNISGAVINGKCECKQSSLGKCSHVTALLLFLAKYIEEYGCTPVASTSKACEWGKGSNIRNPGPTPTTHYPIKRYKPHKRVVYNPLPNDYVRNIDLNSFLKNIQSGGEMTMFETLFSIQYEDFEFSAEELVVIKLQTQTFLNNMQSIVNTPKKFFEIPGTFPQGTGKWLYWRTYFLTSSNVKLICGLTSDSAKKTFLLKNLWRQTKHITTSAMQYGKRNELVARKQYAKMLKPGYRIVEYGLVVNKNFPFLGSSIDGLVINTNNEIDHIFEIKCPKVLEKCAVIYEFDKFLTKQQLSHFFLQKVNNKILIKRSHPYLYQILVSLIVFDVECCNILVWNPKGLLVIPISKKNYDKEIEVIRTKTKEFYEHVYVPELFVMRVVRDLNPIYLDL